MSGWMRRTGVPGAGAFVAVVLAAAAPALAASARGEIAAVGAETMEVKTLGGKVLTLKLPDGLQVRSVRPIALSEIVSNSFIGTAAVAAGGGALKALEVLVFPENMRGTGEGHRDYDLLPDSSMTNGTVTGVVAGNQGRELTATAKGETYKILVPEGTPVVTIDPGSRALLTVGAKVVVPYDDANGSLTARFVAVGKDGFMPPM